MIFINQILIFIRNNKRMKDAIGGGELSCDSPATVIPKGEISLWKNSFAPIMDIIRPCIQAKLYLFCSSISTLSWPLPSLKLGFKTVDRGTVAPWWRRGGPERRWEPAGGPHQTYKNAFYPAFFRFLSSHHNAIIKYTYNFSRSSSLYKDIYHENI
jgi:hypothetical protein